MGSGHMIDSGVVLLVSRIEATRREDWISVVGGSSLCLTYQRSDGGKQGKVNTLGDQVSYSLAGCGG